MPVSEEDVPDYRTIVKKPMDFQTMTEKIESYAYSSLEEFKVSKSFLVVTNKLGLIRIACSE